MNLIHLLSLELIETFDHQGSDNRIKNRSKKYQEFSGDWKYIKFIKFIKEFHFYWKTNPLGSQTKKWLTRSLAPPPQGWRKAEKIRWQPGMTPFYMPANGKVYTHSHSHKQTHIQSHTLIYTDTHTVTHICSHTHTLSHILTQILGFKIPAFWKLIPCYKFIEWSSNSIISLFEYHYWKTEKSAWSVWFRSLQYVVIYRYSFWIGFILKKNHYTRIAEKNNTGVLLSYISCHFIDLILRFKS